MAQQAQPQFVRASDRESDPVGQLGDDWGFWDETWANWHGGFADEAAARAGLGDYARSLEGQPIS